MQQDRLWEITSERKLAEIQARSSGLEQWLEDWLLSDIPVVDPDLMFIGRQVRNRVRRCHRTSLHRGQRRPGSRRTEEWPDSQGIHGPGTGYSSWVLDLEFGEVVSVADRYLGGPGSFATTLKERFEMELLEQLQMVPAIWGADLPPNLIASRGRRAWERGGGCPAPPRRRR